MEKLNININSKLHYRFRSKFMRLKNNFHQLHYAKKRQSFQIFSNAEKGVFRPCLKKRFLSFRELANFEKIYKNYLKKTKTINRLNYLLYIK